MYNKNPVTIQLIPFIFLSISCLQKNSAVMRMILVQIWVDSKL